MIIDKEKQKEHSDKHYLLNKHKIIQRSIENCRKARLRNKEYVNDYLSINPCIDCGESDPIVLEFDHVIGDKRKEVSIMVQKGYSIETIEEEISKCEVRCCNCHRRITHKRRHNRSIA